MTRTVTWFLLVLVLASPVQGDALDAAAASPATRPWRLYESAHFRIYSDVKPRQMQRTIESLETFHAAVRYLTSTVDAPATSHETRFYIFERYADFQALHKGTGVLGFMTPGLRYNLMAAAKPPRHSILRSETAVVFHEYVHQLVRSTSGFRYPTWYDEGFAELLSTVRPGRRALLFGLPPAPAVRALREATMPLDELLNVRPNSADDLQRKVLFYAKAWLFTHYLLFSDDSATHGHAQALRQYLRAYDQGQLTAASFAEFFGMSTQAMDARLAQYLPKLHSFELPQAALQVDARYQERALALDEARYELGQLLQTNDVAGANVLYRAIPADSPWHGLARSALGLLALQQGATELALQQQRQAIAQLPDDYRVQLALADCLLAVCANRAGTEVCRDPTERRVALAHYHRAWELAPERAESSARYGNALLQAQQARRALPILQQAAQLLPGHYQLVVSLGMAHMQLQQWQAAEFYLQRARGWTQDAPEEQERIAGLLALLERARDAGAAAGLNALPGQRLTN